MTDYQKNFRLEYFFENERYPGWRNIATELLNNGECIVAGDTCIWKTPSYPISLFITLSEAEGTVGCSLYKFDLDKFLKSPFYTDRRESFIKNILFKKTEIERVWEKACTL